MTVRPAREAFRRGALWGLIASAAGVALPLLVFVLFARALPPEIIGRFALAVAMSELLKVLGAPGLYEAMLARRDETGRDQAAALAVFLSAGAGLFLLYGGMVWLVLWATGGLPQGPAAGAELALLMLIGLRIPVDLALLQPQAELARRGAYARLAQRGLAANGGAAALGLGLLWAGMPLLGFTAYSLALSGLLAVATIWGTGTLRRPRWDRAALAEMRADATAASAVRAAGTLSNQADQLCVGALLGPAAFALYNLGKRVEQALGTVANTFNQSLFQPHFAGAAPLAWPGVMRTSLLLLTASCGAGVAALCLTADVLIGLLLGPAWLPAAPAVILLGLAGLARAVAVAHAALLSVSGRNQTLFRAILISTTAGLPLVALAALWGPAAAAAVAALRVVLTAGWLARLTRAPGASVWALHARCVLLPFALMLAAATAARLALAGLAWAPPLSAAQALLTLAGTGTAALLAGLPFLLAGRGGRR